MPNFRYSQSYVQRSARKNVVATAAYNAGEKLYDEGWFNAMLANAAYQAGEKLGQNGRTFNFENKARGVLHKEIVAPDGAPSWVYDRQELWNRADQAEKRHDSRLARKLTISLPHELSPEQNIELMRGFIKERFVSQGLVVDFAIHAPDFDANQRHVHCHLLLSRRELMPAGFGKLFRGLEQGKALQADRKAFEQHTNRALERAGIEARVSSDSLYARGIVREPEPVLGDKGTEEMRRKKHSRRGTLDEKTKERIARFAQVRMRNSLRREFDEKGEPHPDWLMRYYWQGRAKWMERQQVRIDRTRRRGNVKFAQVLERRFKEAKEKAQEVDAAWLRRTGVKKKLFEGAREEVTGNRASAEAPGAAPKDRTAGQGRGAGGGRGGGGGKGPSGPSPGGRSHRSPGDGGRRESGYAPNSRGFIMPGYDPALDARGNRRDKGDSGFILDSGINQITKDLQSTFPNAPKRMERASDFHEKPPAAQSKDELRQRDPGKDFGLTGLPSGQHSLPEERLGLDREEDERER